MKLTGKCKENFDKWIKSEMFYLGKEPLSDLFISALIIDFFDSVGIHLFVEQNFKDWWFVINDRITPCDFGFRRYIQEDTSINREESYKKAIESANEIYNSRP